MKKLLFLFSFLLLPCLSYAISPIDEDDNIRVHYVKYAISSSTNIVLMDLSDITNYKHKYTGNFVISDISLNVERMNTSTGTVKIGVMNFVNASTGSVTYFYEKQLYQVSDSTEIINIHENYSPSLIRCKVVPSSTVNTNGSTPYIASNNSTSGSTVFQSDVRLLNSLETNIFPNVGDIILTVDKGSAGGVLNVSVTAHYHSKR
jgi:hypothetical protein